MSLQNINDLSANVQEYNLKVLVVGETFVGDFLEKYKPTLGADFALKVFDWDSTSRVHLQLWDLAGHERYGHMSKVYYKYAMAAFIVFDLSRPSTWNAVLKWYDDLVQNIVTEDGNTIPIVLLANKCDKTGYDKTYLTSFCEEHGFKGWLPVSAKTNKNVDEAMRFIVSRIFATRPDKRHIRPGTPWFRAESPFRPSDMTVFKGKEIENASDMKSKDVMQHKGCC